MNAKRAVILVLLICVSFSAGVFANSGIEKIEAYLRPDFQVFLDGDKVDVGKVLVYEGSSYLPLAKIGSLIGADVVWNADNKGIYINSRFAGQPDPIVDKDLKYESIKMMQAAGYNLSYLGMNHPVLAVMTADYKMYYRDKDIRRMGINTDGLTKAKEQATEELYLLEEEIIKAAAKRPEFYPAYEKLVIGQIDSDQLNSLQNYINGLPAFYEATITKDLNNPQYYSVPYIYVIEALPNGLFVMIGREGSDIKEYQVTLKKNYLDQIYISADKIRTLVTNTGYY